MSKKKSALLDERIEKFFKNSTELLTDIHARNKAAGTKGATKKKRGKRKPPSLPNPNIDSLDEDPSGI